MSDALTNQHSLEVNVERAMRHLQRAWLNRQSGPGAVEQVLDELDVAIALWLKLHVPAGLTPAE